MIPQFPIGFWFSGIGDFAIRETAKIADRVRKAVVASAPSETILISDILDLTKISRVRDRPLSEFIRTLDAIKLTRRIVVSETAKIADSIAHTTIPRYVDHALRESIKATETIDCTPPTIPPPVLDIALDETYCSGGVPQYMIYLQWTNGDSTAQTELWIDGVLVSTYPDAAYADDVSVSPPYSGYTFEIKLRHVKSGVYSVFSNIENVMVVDPC